MLDANSRPLRPTFDAHPGDLESARRRWEALPVTTTGPLGDARRVILSLLAENRELRGENARLMDLNRAHFAAYPTEEHRPTVAEEGCPKCLTWNPSRQ